MKKKKLLVKKYHGNDSRVGEMDYKRIIVRTR